MCGHLSSVRLQMSAPPGAVWGGVKAMRENTFANPPLRHPLRSWVVNTRQVEILMRLLRKGRGTLIRVVVCVAKHAVWHVGGQPVPGYGPGLSLGMLNIHTRWVMWWPVGEVPRNGLRRVWDGDPVDPPYRVLMCK